MYNLEREKMDYWKDVPGLNFHLENTYKDYLYNLEREKMDYWKDVPGLDEKQESKNGINKSSSGLTHKNYKKGY